MKDVVFDDDQAFSLDEVRPATLEVVDLQEGEIVSTASAEHTPPSGSPIPITTTVDTPLINILLGPFSIAGYHYVRIRAEGDLGSRPEVLFTIWVRSA